MQRIIRCNAIVVITCGKATSSLHFLSPLCDSLIHAFAHEHACKLYNVSMHKIAVSTCQRRKGAKNLNNFLFFHCSLAPDIVMKRLVVQRKNEKHSTLFHHHSRQRAISLLWEREWFIFILQLSVSLARSFTAATLLLCFMQMPTLSLRIYCRTLAHSQEPACKIVAVYFYPSWNEGPHHHHHPSSRKMG